MDWIKIMCNLLDHRKIKMVRKGPEGNTLVLLWLLMLAEAGKSSRGGYLMVSDSMPYSAETLGMVTDIPLPTVHLGLKTFAMLDMIDQEDGAIFIRNWGKYQSEDKLEARRESDRKRQQLHRQNERQKLLVVSPPELMSRDSNVTRSRDVTLQNREDKKQEETTLEQVHLLLSGTALNNVLNHELWSLYERYGLEQLLKAADIAAQTWRRKKEQIANPGGYLRSLCASLMVPGWYLPLEARNAHAQASNLKKIALGAEQEEARVKEETLIADRNALWDSLTEEERESYRSAVLVDIPASLLPSMSTSVTKTAMRMAWDEITRSNRNQVGGADES